MSNPTLFDTPKTIVSGRPRNVLPRDGEVFFFTNFFSKQESDRLFKDLLEKSIWQQDQIKFYGKLMDIPRLTAWYGDNDKLYTYSGIPMKPHTWTPDLLEIKSKIEREASVNFSNVLLNRYRSGKDGVAWHCDDEKELGKNPVIGSVSFGATRTFKFRNREDKKIVEKLELTHGSFVLMQGETQHKWHHEIPKITSKTKVIGERINLTFRVIK